MIRVDRQPNEEKIKIQTKYNDACVTINVLLKLLTEKDRGQVYWWYMKNMKRYCWFVPE